MSLLQLSHGVSYLLFNGLQSFRASIDFVICIRHKTLELGDAQSIALARRSDRSPKIFNLRLELLYRAIVLRVNVACQLFENSDGLESCFMLGNSLERQCKEIEGRRESLDHPRTKSL